MKVAIVVGHSRRSMGACNQTYAKCEWEWNNDFARDLQKIMDIPCQLVYRDSLRTLPDEINKTGADFVISLHCNAYNERAQGCETLYYHRSKLGKTIAFALQNKVTQALYNKDRGIKAKTAEDRGGFLLRYTYAPCIIAEPFFIDNDIDFANAQMHRDLLLFAFKEAIDEIANYLKEEYANNND